MTQQPTIFWLGQTQSAQPADLTWLAEAERRFLAGLRFPRRRADWLLGRWTVKAAARAAWPRLVGAELPDWTELAVLKADSGAPVLFRRGQPAPLSVSLSHRAGCAVCALAPAGHPLGIDLEKIEPRSPSLVTDFFTPAEQEQLRRADPERQTMLANLIWSAKESALKALTTGLSVSTQQVELLPPAMAETDVWQPFLIRVHYLERDLSGWWMQWPGFVITLACDGPVTNPPVSAL